MKPKFLMLIALLVSGLGFAQQPAQNPPAKPVRFIVNSDHVKPGMAQQYEQAMKNVVAFFKANNVTAPSFYFTTFQGTEFDYVYVTSFGDFADLDKSRSDYNDLGKQVGAEKLDQITNSANPYIESSETWELRYRPDLSYKAETGAPNPSENRYRMVEYYYVMADKDNEAESVAKDWLALFKSKKIADSYEILQGGIGPATPLWVVVRIAKDEGDLAAKLKQQDEAFGDAGKQLEARTFAITRKFSQHGLWTRPDLSYVPGAMGSRNSQ